MAIGVDQNRYPAIQVIVVRGYIEAFKEPVLHIVGIGNLWSN
jgi:hypothetical protein